jgi:septum formation protein
LSVEKVLVLASGSPRRSEILQGIGVPFVVRPVPMEEPLPADEDHAHPARFVEYLSRFKAEHYAETLPESTLVLAADTVVWLDGRILNKPEDEEDAVAMLSSLCGKTHTVFTGVCLRQGAEYSVLHEATQVTFGPRDETWIRTYVATGEPMDKAGGYAAQGKGALLIEKIEGDFWNVVGLPIYRTAQLLKSAGLAVEGYWRD